MIIDKKSKKNMLLFQEVKDGMLFEYDDTFYIKIPVLYNRLEIPKVVRLSCDALPDIEYEPVYYDVNAIQMTDGSKSAHIAHNALVEVFPNATVTL